MDIIATKHPSERIMVFSETIESIQKLKEMLQDKGICHYRLEIRLHFKRRERYFKIQNRELSFRYIAYNIHRLTNIIMILSFFYWAIDIIDGWKFLVNENIMLDVYAICMSLLNPCKSNPSKLSANVTLHQVQHVRKQTDTYNSSNDPEVLLSLADTYSLVF